MLSKRVFVCVSLVCSRFIGVMLLSLMLVISGCAATKSEAEDSCNYSTLAVLDELDEFAAPVYALSGNAVVRAGKQRVQVITRDGKKKTYPLPDGARTDWYPSHLVTSTDGRKLLFRTYPGAKPNHPTSRLYDPVDLHELDLELGTSRLIGHFSDSVREVVYSPDNARLAVLTKSFKQDQRLQVVELSTGEVSTIWDTRGGLVRINKWSEKGDRIFVTLSGAKDDSLISFSIKDKSRMEVGSGFPKTVGSSRSELDDTNGKIAFGTKGCVMIADMTGENEQQLDSVPDNIVPSPVRFSPSGRFVGAQYCNLPSWKYTGFSIIDLDNGTSAKIHVDALKKRLPTIMFLQWHPSKDVLLVEYHSGERMELREYSAADVLNSSAGSE